MKKPKKLDFEVYESVHADPEYKIHEGIVYNNHMYKEALREFEEVNLNSENSEQTSEKPEDGTV